MMGFAYDSLPSGWKGARRETLPLKLPHSYVIFLYYPNQANDRGDAGSVGFAVATTARLSRRQSLRRAWRLRRDATLALSLAVDSLYFEQTDRATNQSKVASPICIVDAGSLPDHVCCELT